MPARRIRRKRSRGTSFWGEPLFQGGVERAQALSARARQLTLQAYERDFAEAREQTAFARSVRCGLRLPAARGRGRAGIEHARLGQAPTSPPPANTGGTSPDRPAVPAGAQGQDRERHRRSRRSARRRRWSAAIDAANQIVAKPYIYGGGHQSFTSRRLRLLRRGRASRSHGAGLVDSPLDSRDFMKWGERGKGQWITVYTNPGTRLRRDRRPALRHRLPRPRLEGARRGTRQRSPLGRPRPTRGYHARHPDGLCRLQPAASTSR